MTTKTVAGGVLTFLCFGILIGYSIYQLVLSYNATLNKNITVETNTMYLGNNEVFSNFTIGNDKM